MTKRRKNNIKAILKVLLCFFGILILASILIPYFYRDRIESILKSEVNKRLDAQVDWDKVQLSIWRSFPLISCRIQNASIRGIESFEQIELVRAENIFVSVGLNSLMNRNIPLAIRNFKIDNSIFNVVVKSNGKANYQILKNNSTAERQSANVNLDIRHYDMVNSRFYYSDTSVQNYLSGVNINLEGSALVLSEKMEILNRIKMDSLEYRQGSMKYLNGLAFNAESLITVENVDKSVHLSNFQIHLNDLPLHSEGEIVIYRDSQEYKLQLLGSQARFKDFLSVLPAAYTQEFENVKAGGEFEFALNLNGSLIPKKKIIPRFKLNARILDGHFHYPDLPLPVENINATITANNPHPRIEGSIIHVSDIGFVIDGEKMNGNLQYTYARDPLLSGQLKGKLDLEKLSRAYPIEAEKLNGKVQIDLSVNTSQQELKGPVSAPSAINGKIDISDLTYQMKSQPEISAAQVVATAANGALDIKAPSLRIGNSNSYFSAKIPDAYAILGKSQPIKGDIEVRASSIDYNEFKSQKSANNEPNAQFESYYTRLDLSVKVDADTIYYNDYIIHRTSGTATLKNDKLTIGHTRARIGSSEMSISGYLDNVYDYAMYNQDLQGRLALNSEVITLEDFMISSKKPDNSGDQGRNSVRLPAHAYIDIEPDIKSLKYGKLIISHPTGEIKLIPHQINLQEFKGSALKGTVYLNASYNTSNPSQPGFFIEYDLSSLDFTETVEAVKFLKFVAPVAQFIKGRFHSKLQLSGTTNELLFPDLGSLSGSGFLETFDASLSGFEPVEKIKQFFQLGSAGEWALKNSRNWFEIKNGAVFMKDVEFKWQNIRFNISGQHQLNGNLQYTVQANVPWAYLKKISSSSTASESLKKAYEKLSGSSFNIIAEDSISMDLVLTGPVNNMKLAVNNATPLKLKNPNQILSAAKDKLISQVTDSIKSAILGKTDSTDLQSGLNKTINADSLTKILKIGKDSLVLMNENALEDLLKNKSKAELDSIQSKLKDLNPFKKKKKNN